MNFKQWLKDEIKGTIVGFVIFVPIIYALLKIIFATGEYFVLFVGIFLTIIVMLLIVIAPICIMPIFNKYDQIEENDMKKHIEALSTSLNYPLSKIEIVDGSKRSGHSNAF